MNGLDTLVVGGFVVAVVLNYLQGYYGAKRKKAVGSGRALPPVQPRASLIGDDPEGVEPTVATMVDTWRETGIPRHWLDAAMPAPTPSPLQDAIAWEDGGRSAETLELFFGEPHEDRQLMAELGLVNPATGLPMVDGGPLDLAGNRFGEDATWHNGDSTGQEPGGGDSHGQTSSASSWDEYP